MPVFIGLDIGVKRDSSAIVVVNGESIVIGGKKESAIRLVDHKIFVPTPGQPVDLEQVEQVILDYKKKYPNCTVVYDPREMELMSQRLKRMTVKIEEFPQTPSALSALSQNLYDLIRYQRLMVYPDERLRNSIINCIAEEKSTGLRLIKRSSSPIDVVIALGMAALRCIERHTSSVDWAWKYRAFDPNYEDPDAPQSPELKNSVANRALLGMYQGIDAAWGAPPTAAPDPNSEYWNPKPLRDRMPPWAQ